METAVIEARFRGPAVIGHGGHVAGRMAALLGEDGRLRGIAQVLWVTPPRKAR